MLSAYQKHIIEMETAQRNKESNWKRQDFIQKNMTTEERIRFLKHETAISKDENIGNISTLMTKQSKTPRNKMFFRSVSDFSEDAEAVYNIVECYGLNGFSNAELIAFCKVAQIPYSNRNKSELISGLSAWYSDIQKQLSHVDETIGFAYGDMSMLEYVASASLHGIVARSCIKKIAGNPKFHGNSACSEIVKSGFSDVVVDDIIQDMFVTVATMVEKGILTITGGFFEYSEYMTGYTYSVTDNNGDETIRKGRSWNETAEALKRGAELVGVSHRSVWADFISSVQRTLDSYKGTDATRAKVGNYVIDSESFADCGEYVERLISDKSSQYVNVLISQCDKEIEVETNVEIESFISSFKEKFPKQADRFNREIFYFLNGFTEIETAEIMGVSRRTIQLDKALAKSFYHGKYGKSMFHTNHTISGFYGCVYRHSESGCGGSYGHHYGVTTIGKDGLYPLHVVSGLTETERRTKAIRDAVSAFGHTPIAIGLKWHNIRRDKSGTWQFEKDCQF